MSETKLKRICPQCGDEIFYEKKCSFYMAEKRNSTCWKCRNNNLIGANNPFFGKHHTEETKSKISDFNSKERVLSEEFLQKARDNLSKVSNSKHPYDIWLEKYGKEIADQKFMELRIKNSQALSGNKNPMFGKPSPQGSGNGWSGWYKGWFFRSIRELSYVILVLEKNDLKWEVPDKKFRIQYIDYDGKIRNYFPDFIVCDKIIVEIKPKKLHNSPKVLAKKIAAIKFCEENGFKYEIIDPPMLAIEKMIDLYTNKDVKFLEKYDLKFREKYIKV